MRLERKFLGPILAAGLLASMTLCAGAAYTFDGVPETGYYQSTSYEEVYGARYNYGGKNVSEYQIPALEYGVFSNAGIGIMDRPGQMISTGGLAIDMGGVGVNEIRAVDGSTPFSALAEAAEQALPSSSVSVTVSQKAGYTSVADMKQSDGSIGTIQIPSLNITQTPFVKGNFKLFSPIIQKIRV